MTRAMAERGPQAGKIQISQGLILTTTLPKGASKDLYNEEMRRPAAWEKSANSGVLRQMANEVERMPVRSTQAAENSANFWMGRAYEAERDRLVGEFDRSLSGTQQY
jgi:hypothetical protein